MANKDNEVKNKKHFWKDFKAELKKVIWPTKKQLANNTAVVVGMVLITAVVVLVLDLAFEALNTYGINKVKSAVKNSNTSSQTTTDNNTSSNNEATSQNSTTEAQDNVSEEDTNEVSE